MNHVVWKVGPELLAPRKGSPEGDGSGVSFKVGPQGREPRNLRVRDEWCLLREDAGALVPSQDAASTPPPSPPRHLAGLRGPSALFRGCCPQLLAPGQALLTEHWTQSSAWTQVSSWAKGNRAVPGTTAGKVLFSQGNLLKMAKERPRVLSGPPCYHFRNPCLRIKST